MKNRNYVKGRRLEYEVKQYLMQKGWFVVRSAGSHSPFDLIAIKDGVVSLIQCKNSKINSINPIQITVDEYLKNRNQYTGKLIKFKDVLFPQYLAVKKENPLTRKKEIFFYEL